MMTEKMVVKGQTVSSVQRPNAVAVASHIEPTPIAEHNQ